MPPEDKKDAPKVTVREIGSDETYCIECREFTEEKWVPSGEGDFYVIRCQHCGAVVHRRLGLHFTCPKCDEVFEHQYESSCKECSTRIIFCEDCGKYGTVRWVRLDGSPSVGINCCYCGHLFPRSVSVIKSDIYKQFKYAFKFVNRHHIAYPRYFAEEFPFGTISEDLGSYSNDFIFAEEVKNEAALLLGTDYGTARGYRVSFEADGDSQECVVLSHETGLEVFLIAAGAFVGMEVAKFSLKRLLEAIEKSINGWYQKKGKRGAYRTKEVQTDDHPLVEKIAVRTPYWELTVDGSFTPAERERILDFLQNTAIPQEVIEDQFHAIEDSVLERKMIGATRKITRRFTPRIDEGEG